MPVARVSINGRIARVEVPEGTTPQQAVQIARRAIAQQALVDVAAPKPRGSTGSGVLDTIFSTVNELVIGGFEGINNLGRVFTDPMVGAIFGKEVLQKDRNRSRETFDNASRILVARPMPVMRTAGQVASSLPFASVRGPALIAKVAPKVAPTATRIMQGAIGGAAVRDTDQNAGGSMAIGAAANAILPPALGGLAKTKIGQSAIAATGRAAAAARARLPFSPPPRLPAASPPPPTLAPLGRAAQVRAARLRSAGVERPTTGMVTRDPRAWTAERELAKRPGVGDGVQQSITDAGNQISARAGQLVDAQGGRIGAEATGQKVSAALGAKNEQLQKEIGALYTAVRSEVGDVRVTSLDNFKAAQAHPEWADGNEFDNMVAAVNKRLLRYADADGGLTGLTVKQAEELRKFIGGLGTNSSQTFAQRRVLQDGLDADVLENVGGAPFATARAAARARFEEFKGTFAGKVADEALAPEALTKRIMSAPLSDVRDLRKSLTTGTPQQQAAGGEALKAIRAQAVSDHLGRNITSDGTNTAINGKALADSFTANAPRFRELLDPADYKNLRRLSLAARDTASPPANSYVNYSNTSSASHNSAAGLFPGLSEPKGMGLLGKGATRAGSALVGATLGSIGGPAGSVAAGMGAYGAAQGIENLALANATTAYQRRLAEQATLARDPYAAAAQLNLPNSDEVIRMLGERVKNLAGNSPVVGGLAAAPRKRKRR